MPPFLSWYFYLKRSRAETFENAVRSGVIWKRCARNPTVHDHVAARLPRMVRIPCGYGEHLTMVGGLAEAPTVVLQQTSRIWIY